MKQSFRSNLRDFLALGLLIFLILLFLNQALAPGKVLMPLDIVLQAWPPWQQPNQTVVVHNDILTDVINYIYPVKEFAAESIRNGVLPLWNPYEFTGYPFTYNTQAGVFYPLSLFYYLLPAVTAVDLVIIVQMSLGACFMFLYLRRIKLRRIAALIGAAVFIFNGLMVGWLEWQVVHAAIIWLPAQLYLVERIADKLADKTMPKRFSMILGDVIGLGLLFAIPWLGGHWSWTLYSSMTLVVYMGLRFDMLRAAYSFVTRKKFAIDKLRLSITAVTSSLFIGIGLSLVQVLPAFNYLSQSHRQALSINESMRQGLFSRGIVFLLPNFFGNAVDGNWWGPKYSNFAETIFYSAVLTLLLACLVLFMRKDFYSRFFSAWGGLTLLWALGSPAYFVLFILPVFNGIQPSRAAFLVAFCLAVLAALAVDRLMKAKIERPQLLSRVVLIVTGLFLLIGMAYFLYYRADVLRTWDYLQPNVARFAVFLLGSVVLLLARIRSWIKPRLFASLALTWIIADLFLFGYGYNTVSDVTDLYTETAVSTFLQNDSELHRIVTPAKGLVFVPNTALVMRIQNLSGYEPGVLRRISTLLELAEGESTIRFGRVILPLESIDSPILDMLNVKYVTTTRDYWAAEPKIDAAQEKVEEWSLLPVEQMFTMGQAGLQRLDMPLQLSDSAEGTVIVRILSEDGVYEFAHAEIETAVIEDSDWNSFFFEPFPSTWGRTFRFRVEFAGDGGEVQVGTSQENEVAHAAYYLPRPELAFEDGTTRIYLNDGYFSRAFIVPQAQIVANEEEALTAVANNQDRLREIVFLELEGQPMPPLLQTAVSPDTQVIVKSYEINQIELAVDLDEPGFLVLSDTYYSGWKARIDGAETPLYRANSLLRAIYVPAGSHTITFSFMPLDFVAGGIISLTTLAFCLLGLLLALRMKRATPAPIDAK